jgi:hypothetical protein
MSLVFGDGNNDQLNAKTTANGAYPGNWISLHNVDTFSAQLCTTDNTGKMAGGAGGGVAGTWKVEVSNSIPTQPEQIRGMVIDPLNLNGVVNDISADFTPAIPAATGTGISWPVTMALVPYKYIRFTLTATSGTAANQRAAAYVVGKEV